MTDSSRRVDERSIGALYRSPGDQAVAACAPLVAGPEVHPVGAWTPLAGAELLDRLRFTGRARPAADPRLRAKLHQTLDDGLAAMVGPELDFGAAPLVVTKARLNCALGGADPDRASFLGERPITMAMACGSVIGALFRQLITAGSIGEPMTDGLAALSVDDRQASMAAWIEGLQTNAWDQLAAEVRRQAADLVARWPALRADWLPRTEESMRVGLAGGAVELSARADLSIGRPGLDAASVVLVAVKSGMRRSEHRTDLHFYALIEALRHPAPPFAVATYYTRSGELDVEPVDEGMLDAAVQRTLQGVQSMRVLPDPCAEGNAEAGWDQ